MTYSFLLTNTGNVAIADVGVVEGTFTGSGTLSPVTCPAAAALLAPAAQATCTATYTLTQADVDAGTVSNTATATGTPQGSSGPIESAPDTATVTIDAAPGLSVDKSADPSTAHAAGEIVSYSFLVTNTGNVTMTDVTVDEAAFTGTGPMSIICPAGAASLAPAAQLTCTAAYTLTQADVDAGHGDEHGDSRRHRARLDHPDPAVRTVPTIVTIDAGAVPVTGQVRGAERLRRGG